MPSTLVVTVCELGGKAVLEDCALDGDILVENLVTRLSDDKTRQHFQLVTASGKILTRGTSRVIDEMDKGDLTVKDGMLHSWLQMVNVPPVFEDGTRILHCESGWVTALLPSWCDSMALELKSLAGSSLTSCHVGVVPEEAVKLSRTQPLLASADGAVLFVVSDHAKVRSRVKHADQESNAAQNNAACLEDTSYAQGDVVEMRFDRDTGHTFFAHNGSWTQAVPAASTSNERKRRECVGRLRKGRLGVSVYQGVSVELVPPE